ncbi:hypothetical protein [Gordonia hirsuta]|uniref:hypothetical protein n=1 Tax=Gordonia hirsuta TaxID=53427 RepID=UPI00034B6402|nr:hypothetical protein [Gordonia hirsuta]
MGIFATGCSVSGTPQAAPDHAALLLPADSFPGGAGTTVPDAQIPGIIADVTQRPLRGEVDPAECTPPQVHAAGAAAVVGPASAGGATLTELVVEAPDSLERFATVTSACNTFRSGATGNQEVSTTVTAQPLERDGVSRMQLTRTLRSAGADTTTDLEDWIAQRGRTRLIVQLRGQGPASDNDRQAAQTFFDEAVTHAFSRR